MSKHILVIGGGVIGLCCAYYATRAGHRVTLLEANTPDRDMASLGNAGMVVPSHVTPLATPSNVKYGLRNVLNPESPFYIRPRADKALIEWGLKFMRSANAAQIAKAEVALRDLGLASRELYRSLAGDPDMNFDLVERGLLMLCNTDDGLHHEADYAAHVNALGVTANVLSAAETRALDPGISLDITGSVHFPNDAHMAPRQFIDSLTHWLERNGAQIQYDRSVSDWHHSGGRVSAVTSVSPTELMTARFGQKGAASHFVAPENPGEARQHTADEFVIAGGAWSDAIGAQLGIDLPLQGGKGYSLTLPKPRQSPKVCSILVEARAAVTPMGDTLRVGGTMEIAGKDLSINPRRVNGVIKSFVRYYTAFTPQDFEQVKPWRGLRPVTPDGVPYIGRLGKYANVSVAAGHAMVGLSLAPITGKLIAEIVSERTPTGFDMAMLRPERFGA
jgi:D-amino-acid dehydrogenase